MQKRTTHYIENAKRNILQRRTRLHAAILLIIIKASAKAPNEETALKTMQL